MIASSVSWLSSAKPASSARDRASEHRLVVARHHLGEPRRRCGPVLEQRAADGGAGVLHVPLDEHLQQVDVLAVERLEVDHLGVDPLLVQVEDVRRAAAHAGREVAADATEHDHLPARHVLAAVVADALDDGGGAAVADREPLPHQTPHEDLAVGGAVEQHVAGDDVALRHQRRVRRRADRDPAARQALAEVVVRVADQPQGDAARQERAERLAGRAGQRDVDRAVGQPGATVPPGDLGTEHRADGAVHVAHRELEPHRLRRARGRRPPAR